MNLPALLEDSEPATCAGTTEPAPQEAVLRVGSAVPVPTQARSRGTTTFGFARSFLRAAAAGPDKLWRPARTKVLFQRERAARRARAGDAEDELPLELVQG